MMKCPALAALALLAFAPLTTQPAAAGVEDYAGSRHHHPRRVGKRPRIIPSSARHPGGRCGRLNLERARLYGLCR